MSADEGSANAMEEEVRDYIVDVSGSPVFVEAEFKKALLGIQSTLNSIITKLRSEFRRRNVRYYDGMVDTAIENKKRLIETATELYILLFPHIDIILKKKIHISTAVILSTVIFPFIIFVVPPLKEVSNIFFKYLKNEIRDFSQQAIFEEILSTILERFKLNYKKAMDKEEEETYFYEFKRFMNLPQEVAVERVSKWFLFPDYDDTIDTTISFLIGNYNPEIIKLIEKYYKSMVVSITTTDNLSREFASAVASLKDTPQYREFKIAMRFINSSYDYTIPGTEHFKKNQEDITIFLINDLFKTTQSDEADVFFECINILNSLNPVVYGKEIGKQIEAAKKNATSAMDNIYKLIPNPMKIDLTSLYSKLEALNIVFMLANADERTGRIIEMIHTKVGGAFDLAIRISRDAASYANAIINAEQKAKTDALQEAKDKFIAAIAAGKAKREAAAAAAAAAAAEQSAKNAASKKAADSAAKADKRAAAEKGAAARAAEEAAAVAKGKEAVDKIGPKWATISEKPAAEIQSAKITVIDHFDAFAREKIGPLLDDITRSARITVTAVQLRKRTYDALFGRGYVLDTLVDSYREAQGHQDVLGLLPDYHALSAGIIGRICPGARNIGEAIARCADKKQRLLEELPIFVPSVFHYKPALDHIAEWSVARGVDKEAINDAIMCLCMGDKDVTRGWVEQVIYPFMQLRCSTVADIRLDIRVSGNIYIEFRRDGLEKFNIVGSVPHISIHIPKLGDSKAFTTGAFHFAFNKLVDGKPTSYFRRYLFNETFFRPESIKRIPEGQRPVDDTTHEMPDDIIAAVDDCFKYFSCLFSPEASAALIGRRGGALRRTRKRYRLRRTRRRINRASKYRKTRSR